MSLFLRQLGWLIGRLKKEDELRDELKFHLDEEAEKQQEAGLSEAESRYAAKRDLGNLTIVKEDTRSAWGWVLLEQFWQDVRYGWRGLRKSPGFTTVAVLTLALGIGANGAVFSILRAVLLQPLPYRQPDRVAMVWSSPEHPPADAKSILQPANWRGIPTGGLVLAIRAGANDVLHDVATYVGWQGDLDAQFDLVLSDHAERLHAALATPNFFDLLGVTAAEGRVFTAADEALHSPLIVLSDSLWHRAFGGDPSIVGRSLTLITGRDTRQPQTFTVIGVLPPSFRFTYPLETEAWAMYSWQDIARRGPHAICCWTVARLAPGITLSSAQARLAGIPTDLNPPNTDPRYRQIPRLEPITEWVLGETHPSMLLLGGVALLLLLITCANVAGALFVRISGRQRELAVRAAIGASRGRLAEQLLTEAGLLSLAGAALGAGFAAAVAPMVRALVPPTVPRANEIGVNTWILGFFGVAAGVTILLTALMPAIRGARVDLIASLNRATATTSADRSTSRWRQGLVGAQAAIASALLLTAVLLIASFWRLNHVPLGFDGEHVLTVEMRLISPKYLPQHLPGQAPNVTVPSPALVSFQEQLLAGVRALPGMLDAGLTSAVPFRGVDFVFVLHRTDGTSKSVAGNARFVTPGFFSVLKVPIIRGRVFTDADTPTSTPVIVISESYAHRMFGNEDPIGKTIDSERPKVVIGIVGDMHYESLEKDPYPALYLPESQKPNELVCVVARTAPNAGNLAPAIHQIVRRLDPELPVMNLTTVDRIVASSVADRRFYTTATVAFASLALILATLGLLVVVSRLVVERHRELAIRAALGAMPTALTRLVIAQVMAPVAAGTAFGLLSVFASARVLQHFLFQVEPRSPLAYAGVFVLLTAVGLAAALVPARRATRVDPLVALRYE